MTLLGRNTTSQLFSLGLATQIGVGIFQEWEGGPHLEVT